MKKLFLLLLTVVTMAVCAQAQTRTVRGTVIDASDNEPLPGATVVPVGGGQGVATDHDGNFSLTVPQKVTQLTVSYVGMKSQTVKITEGNMRIALENADTKLDEVMVVAYGTAKKSAFTGSAAVVGSAEIEQLQVSNALDALNGSVSGVQLNNASGAPGGSNPTIRIRGISSINAENTPLIVVDGVPYSGDVNNFNTADIESMTVLKDAASNALYGARGANGVILITTKKGKSANAQITVDAKWGANSRSTSDYNTIKSPGEYYEMYYKYLNNYALNSMKYSAEQAHTWANNNITAKNDYGLYYNVYKLPDGEGLIGANGKLNPNATLGNVVNYNGQDYLLTADDWLDEAYRTSLRQEYNMSISQATETSSFYASVGYLDNQGIVQNSNFRRLTTRLAAEIQAKSWLKVGANANYARFKRNEMDEDGTSNSSANIFAAATQIAPIYPVYVRDGEGNIMKNEYGVTMYDFGDGSNAGLERPSYTDSNAIGSSRIDRNSSEGNALNANGYLEIRFLKDFKFTANQSISLDETRFSAVTNPYFGTYAASNGITMQEQLRSTDYSFQQLLNWNHQFGKHNVAVLVGHENYWQKQKVLYATRSNMFNPNNPDLAGAIINENGNSYSMDYDNEGWLFRGQYDFDSKYFGSVSVRRDASSRFHPDHRWGTFWSVGAAWLMHKESWFTAPWVDELKIKASYGEQGNDRIGNLRYVNTYTIVNSNGYPAAQPASMGNENITWEKGGNFNAGVEFSFWNERLSGSVEGFYRKTHDLLFSFPLPPSFGFSSYYANVGDMSNRGVEIELSADVLRGRDYSINVYGNLTFYKNKIDNLPEERKTATYDGHDGYASGNFFYTEGKSIYTYLLPKYAGTNKTNGEPLWYVNNEDGTLGVTNDYSEADYYLCGTALPSTYGGFGTTMKWKGFDLTVDFNYQIGGRIYDSDYASLMASPYSSSKGMNFHKDLYNAWSVDNPTSDIPRLQFGDLYSAASSDRWLVSASYLSLRNINFGYTLPTKLVRKAYLEKVRIYLTCDNVAVWSARKGLDPRQSISGSSTNSYYAPMRTISGGINVVF